jgi:hypothetical protein
MRSPKQILKIMSKFNKFFGKHFNTQNASCILFIASKQMEMMLQNATSLTIASEYIRYIRKYSKNYERLWH